MLEHDFDILRGDAAVLTFSSITNLPSGGLNDYSAIVFTAKRDVENTDADATIQKTLGAGVTITTTGSDVTLGALTVLLNADDTSGLPSHEVRLPYDVQVVDGGQSPARPYTIAGGFLIVSADVTRAIS
jgi:hypothetical protein